MGFVDRVPERERRSRSGLNVFSAGKKKPPRSPCRGFPGSSGWKEGRSGADRAINHRKYITVKLSLSLINPAVKPENVVPRFKLLAVTMDKQV